MSKIILQLNLLYIFTYINLDHEGNVFACIVDEKQMQI